MRVNKNMGFLLLSIWLILLGVSQLIALPIPSLNIILGALAVVSGVFILMGK